MDTLMRRFTIICLTMAIFALGLSALVAQNDRSPKRVHFGTAAPCLHPASPHCVVAL
ncbi:hypothetical protein [Rhizobium sp. RU36D]|uniref:hypothetical protein n=1 Tax=Rhizobium sp. RU36D TaxID=1907415 RepID=UPI0009D80026|nr:hypothetical protein [Rhizobium sp. RU36D]SMD11278.1 hypothetical protein SAMN05880593_12286 [Rhizobium sp. RU36D]